MSIVDYVKVLRRRWSTVLAGVVLGALLAVSFFLLQTKEYTASLELYVSAQATTAPEYYFSSSQLAQDRVESFGDLATSPRVMAAAISDLHLPLSVEQLQDKVTVAVSDKSVLITLSVVDPDPVRAAAIADATGTELAATVSDLERAPTPTSSAPLSVRAVQPAPVPDDTSSTSLKKLLALGLLLGAVIGLAAALLRDALDNSITALDQLAELVDAPVLGGIDYDPSVARAGAEALDRPSSFAESIRRIRTNVQFLDASNPHKVFTVTSAVPAEGKTTLSINLAIALATAGYRVLLVDADLRKPRVAASLQLDDEIGVTSILARRINVRDAVQRARGSNVDILASGPLPPNPSELLGSSQMTDLLEQLRPAYDVILIDTSPLLPVPDALALSASTDGAILVCRAQKTSRAQVRSAADALRGVNATLRGSVLSMSSMSDAQRGSYRSYGQVGALQDAGASISPVRTASDDDVTQTLAPHASPSTTRSPSPRPTGQTNGNARHAYDRER